MSDDNLEDALDGLFDTVSYLEDIGEHELAREVGDLYQRVAKASPNEHWDEVQRYVVFGDDVVDVIEDTEGAMLFDEGAIDASIGLYATSDAVDTLRESDEVERIKVDSDR